MPTESTTTLISVNVDEQTVCSQIKNYFIENPPFEIPQDTESYTKYLSMVDEIFDNSYNEYSEFFPIIEEKKITPDSGWLDIYEDIHPKFMDDILFLEKDEITSFTNFISRYYPNFFRNLQWYDHSSLFGIVAHKDYLNIVDYWTEKTKKRIIYNGSKIKVKEGIEYTILYKRYRDGCELNFKDKRKMFKLMGVNLETEIYSSSIRSSEQGIKKVSISGLSLTFNNPEDMEKQLGFLKKEKQDLISTFIDYNPETF